MQGAISASIVVYKNHPDVLKKTITSFLESVPDGPLYLIDNSPRDAARHLVSSPRIRYFHNGKNIGFGRAHNIALKEAMQNCVRYHLVLNPDVYFDKEAIPKLFRFMESNPDIGLTMPKVLYPDGRLQRLCKLLPTPGGLILRRFFNFMKEKRDQYNYHYELQHSGYNKIMDVPFLSGCFMFLRKEALQKTGVFDESIFLYSEDTDLSRRIHRQWRTVYYPEVTIYHHHEKQSYKSWRLLFHHVRSAIKYFNKWGWWDDPEREQINRSTLSKLAS
jgi:GT2 family glycosyltransferase